MDDIFPLLLQAEQLPLSDSRGVANLRCASAKLNVRVVTALCARWCPRVFAANVGTDSDGTADSVAAPDAAAALGALAYLVQHALDCTSVVPLALAEALWPPTSPTAMMTDVSTSSRCGIVEVPLAFLTCEEPALSRTFAPLQQRFERRLLRVETAAASALPLVMQAALLARRRSALFYVAESVVTATAIVAANRAVAYVHDAIQQRQQIPFWPSGVDGSDDGSVLPFFDLRSGEQLWCGSDAPATAAAAAIAVARVHGGRTLRVSLPPRAGDVTILHCGSVEKLVVERAWDDEGPGGEGAVLLVHALPKLRLLELQLSARFSTVVLAECGEDGPGSSLPLFASPEAAAAVECLDARGLRKCAAIPSDFCANATALRWLLLPPSHAIREVPDGFCAGTASLVHVDLDATFVHVERIGASFFANGSGVVELNLASLACAPCRAIGDDFCAAARRLRSIDLAPLGALTVIPHGFLRDASALASLSLGPLRGVTSIGDDFCAGCVSLVELDISPLGAAARTVGARFLARCAALVTLRLQPRGDSDVSKSFAAIVEHRQRNERQLFAWSAVGDDFLAGCVALQSADLGPLHAVRRFGRGAFSGVSAKVNLAPVRHALAMCI